MPLGIVLGLATLVKAGTKHFSFKIVIINTSS